MDAHRKVMFVDDEEGVRRSWDRYLSEAGFDVTTAEDGDRAIERLAEEPVDVVVSDLKMPGTDGVELLEWIADHKPETRFILLTGYGNEEVERRVRELGAFEYLNKPISPETLSAVVTAATILEKAEERKRKASVGDLGLAVEVEAPVQAEAAAEVAEAVPEATREAAHRAKREQGKVREVLEVAGWLVAAPILGLAFVVFLPVIGFGALLWTLGGIVWDRTDPART